MSGNVRKCQSNESSSKKQLRYSKDDPKSTHLDQVDHAGDDGDVCLDQQRIQSSDSNPSSCWIFVPFGLGGARFGSTAKIVILPVPDEKKVLQRRLLVVGWDKHTAIRAKLGDLILAPLP
jgi:hypothetical protein